MSESLLKSPTLGNLAEAANADINARIAGFWKRASWDNIPTWNDLNNSQEMWVMRVKASWAAVGCSDEMILAEAKRLYAESLK